MTANNTSLKKYLSPLGVWALSFGCSVGWGAFVMPGTTFLPIAGPVGTAIGIALGALIMLIIGRNYYFLMKRYPDAGGTYTYSKKILGYDHGFLSAWFLVLVYVVIIWANLTALALIGRNLLGDMFMFGFHYQIAGYDIYFGEILASVGVLLLCGGICVFRKRLAAWVQILMAVVLIGGIVVCFVAAAVKNGGGFSAYQPAFSTMSSSKNVVQIFSIVALMPWAYVGFESVSHSAEEFKFKFNKSFLIIFISLLTAGLAYILLNFLSVSALPEGYSDWTAYINDLDNLSGTKALPTFYAVSQAMDSAGIVILGITILGGIFTGIIGNMIAASRVLYAISKDDILPKWFEKTNRDGNPYTAIIFITAISAIIPFFGRTAISWIIDVTTVGGTIIYCYTSAAALKQAQAEKNRGMIISGLVGVLFSIGFALYFLVPNLASVSTLSTESYLILTIWSILGLVFFRRVFGKDTERRFGKSIVVWIVLLFLIMFTSIVWMQQENTKAIVTVQNNISASYNAHVEEFHPLEAKEQAAEVEEYVGEQMQKLDYTLLRNNLLRILMIVVAVAIMFMVYTLMSKRQREFETVQDMAYKDQMTGVGNKHAYTRLETDLNKEIAADQISELAVVVCDVNGLKIINDTLGHAEGDKFIRQACAIICEIFAHSPICRIGGDEFVAILRGRDYDDRDRLIEQLRKSNSNNAESGSAVIAFGMSEYERGADKSVDMVFHRADAAMYAEKKALKENNRE